MNYPNEPQNPSYPEDPDHPEEGRGHGKVLHEVLHHNPDYGGDHEDEVKQVPGRGEVVVAETDYLNCALWKQSKQPVIVVQIQSIKIPHRD